MVAFGLWAPWGGGVVLPVCMQTACFVSYLLVFSKLGFLPESLLPPEIPQLTQQENERGGEKVFQVFRVNDNDDGAGTSFWWTCCRC